MRPKSPIIIALLSVLAISACAKSETKSKQKAQATPSGNAFETPEEAKEFLETDFAEGMRANLAGLKIAILDKLGQAGPSASAGLFIPMASYELGDSVEAEYTREATHTYQPGDLYYYDSDGQLKGIEVPVTVTYRYTMRFSGAVTDVDAKGEPLGKGTFAHGDIGYTTKFSCEPDKYCPDQRERHSKPGYGTFALTGLDTDTVSITVTGHPYYGGDSVQYAAPIVLTVKGGKMSLKSEVDGQPVETTVDVNSSGTEDDDNDKVNNASDNCPDNFNYDQADADKDGKGDACDDDADGDGYNVDVDCKDLNASIYPGATEIPGNGVDEDCSGADSAVDTTILTHPATVVASTEASFSFSCPSSSCSFECKVDNGAYSSCTSPATFAGLAEGERTFSVRAVVNGAADKTPANFSWLIDTTAPDTEISTTFSAPVTTSQTAISFSCTGEAQACTFECSSNDVDYSACASPATVDQTSEGEQHFYVRAADEAGNVDSAPASIRWTYDATPPETLIGTTFAGDVTTAETTVSFSCSGETEPCTFECALNNGSYAACTSPLTVKHSSEGEQYLWVRATDHALLRDATPAYVNWNVQYPPVQAAPAKVAAGYRLGCAVNANQLYCWGTGYASTPQLVGTDTDWKSVYSSVDHNCAIKTGGALYCWGANDYKQLGTGDLALRSDPTLIASGTSWSMVTPGEYHTCGIQTDGTLWCWGLNNTGQLGDGSQAGGSVSTPKKIGTDTDWALVGAGGNHSCAVKTTGELYCWGLNSAGQLGTGDNTTAYSPTQIGSSTAWSGLELGLDHTCALQAGGGLYCWGDNSNNQLGHNASPNAPMRVGADTWTRISTAEKHSCGVQTNGTFWCWGNDSIERLGNGTGEGSKSTPFQVGSATDWTDTSVGDTQSYGAKNNALFGWGGNPEGETGTGSALMTNVPDPLSITFP